MKAAGVVKVATKSDATAARVKRGWKRGRKEKKEEEEEENRPFIVLVLHRVRHLRFFLQSPPHTSRAQFPRSPQFYFGDSLAGAITYLAHEISARARVFPLRICAWKEDSLAVDAPDAPRHQI